jgi:hypothetical protein
MDGRSPHLATSPQSVESAWQRSVRNAPRLLRIYSIHLLAAMLGIALAFM